MRKAFLKAPLDIFRITSRFTNARFHPILKRYRAHHGVDYAAPVGTPVKSIGAGTVIAKGYQNGGGNFLKVKHNSVYTTTYMHLSKFAKGIQVGSHVGKSAASLQGISPQRAALPIRHLTKPARLQQLPAFLPSAKRAAGFGPSGQTETTSPKRAGRRSKSN